MRALPRLRFQQFGACSEFRPLILSLIDDHYKQTDSENHFGGTEKLRDLTGHVLRMYPYPSAYGGFADIYMARLNQELVAVKVVRLLTDNEQTRKKLKKVRNPFLLNAVVYTTVIATPTRDPSLAKIGSPQRPPSIRHHHRFWPEPFHGLSLDDKWASEELP